MVIGSRAELAQVGDANVQAVAVQMMKEDMVRAIERVQLVFMEDWSNDYANSDHWPKYWCAESATSEEDRPEVLIEDWDKLYPKKKLLVSGNRVQTVIAHRHNAQLMHLGRGTWQKDLESRLSFPPGYYVVCLRSAEPYCKACVVCRATQHSNRPTARDPMYIANRESIHFQRDRASCTLPRMSHGHVAKEAKAMISEANNMTKKVCDAKVVEHARRAEYFRSGEVH